MPEQSSNIYPNDALAGALRLDTITTSDASTLDQAFRERVRRSPEKMAYCQFEQASDSWSGRSWAEIATEVERWQVAFREQGLQKGDRVAICHCNSIEWVIFDQAALRLGLVVVPLYLEDRPDNIAYVINDSLAKLVLFESADQWNAVSESGNNLSALKTVLLTTPPRQDSAIVQQIDNWLPEQGLHFERGMAGPDDLASIVYTSGTSGRPKGVMLSHKNILSNAYSGMRSIALTPDDRLLSFLPLSHTLERTVGYYAPLLSGSSVYFNRSISQLAEDFQEIRPTALVSVPRIFERIHNQIHNNLRRGSQLNRLLFKDTMEVGWNYFQYSQGLSKWRPQLLLRGLLDLLVARGIRTKLGGELRLAVIGGAPLSLDVSKTFISLGVPLLQGYGLTEASPVVSVNTPSCNRPDSIGLPLRGVEVKIMENDELWVRGDNVMQGYWQNPDATDDAMSGDWLKTGDRGSIDAEGYIRITGRIKDILVLANGEKVAPPEIEAAIEREPMIKQAMVLGEGKAFLAVLLVLDPGEWRQHCNKAGWDDESLSSERSQQFLLDLVAAQIHEFPGYIQIRKVRASFIEWTVESGLLTPTYKTKRAAVKKYFAQEIEELYEGHEVVEN